jgi:hypothetical protein
MNNLLKKYAKNIFSYFGYEAIKRQESPFPLYNQDALRTVHNHDFMKEENFMSAYRRGVKADKEHGWHWRVHVGLWAASYAAKLSGSFVECGTNRGFLSSSIMKYLDWDTVDKMFYLFDTFQGIDERYFNENEILQNKVEYNRIAFSECYEEVKTNFAEFKNVQLIRGSVPESLNLVSIESVCYLHLDMNCAKPEIDAANFFWDKLVSGGIVLLDDYAYVGYEEQKKAFDVFAQEKEIMILSLPTGQGLFIKV